MIKIKLLSQVHSGLQICPMRPTEALVTGDLLHYTSTGGLVSPRTSSILRDTQRMQGLLGDQKGK